MAGVGAGAGRGEGVVGCLLREGAGLVGGGVGSGLAGGGVGRSTSPDSSPRKLLIGSLAEGCALGCSVGMGGRGIAGSASKVRAGLLCSGSCLMGNAAAAGAGAGRRAGTAGVGCRENGEGVGRAGAGAGAAGRAGLGEGVAALAGNPCCGAGVRPGKPGGGVGNPGLGLGMPAGVACTVEALSVAGLNGSNPCT